MVIFFEADSNVNMLIYSTAVLLVENGYLHDSCYYSKKRDVKLLLTRQHIPICYNVNMLI